MKRLLSTVLLALITVISVVLRIIISYYPDYDARNFDLGIFPYIITGLFFLTAFLNPKGNLCRKRGFDYRYHRPCPVDHHILYILPTRSHELELTK